MAKLKTNNVKFARSVGTTVLTGSSPVGPIYSTVSFDRTISNPNIDGFSGNDNFGYSIDIDGSYAVIGTPFGDQGGTFNTGEVHVYDTTTWTKLRSIIPPQVANQYMGYSVAISGNYVISGAYGYSGNSGRVYIHDVTTGSLKATINNPNLDAFNTIDKFGLQVAIHGNYAVVGAPEEEVGGINGLEEGKVYVLHTVSGDWTDAAVLHTINNPGAGQTDKYDHFGYHLDIDDTHFIVGVPNEDSTGTSDKEGRAYIYDIVTGNLVHTLLNPNVFSTPVDDQFGSDVSIHGNLAVVGAYGEGDAGGAGSGKAYIFDVSTGNLSLTLDNPNIFGASFQDRFGVAVSISGNHVVVGAHLEETTSYTSSGAVYVFNATDGTLIHSIPNVNAYGTPADDLFGISLSLNDNILIIGIPYEDDAGGSNSGKVSIYNLS